MEKKFKVESYAWYGKNKTDTYYTFEEAKIGFRNRIISPEGVPHIVDHIKEYAKEHYPENTPVSFQQLADIITNLLTDPSYPKSVDDLVLEEFEDDNIEFHLAWDGCGKIFCYVNNEEYDGKFPIAEIHVAQMDNEEEEYYFYLTEKKDGHGWSWNYSLSPISDDEDIDDSEDED